MDFWMIAVPDSGFADGLLAEGSLVPLKGGCSFDLQGPEKYNTFGSGGSLPQSERLRGVFLFFRESI